jgi:hypothetical protein
MKNPIECIIERYNRGGEENSLNALSCTEQIVVALVINTSWLPKPYDTIESARDRLGEDWWMMVKQYRESH